MERHYLEFLAGGYDRNAVLKELMQSYGEDVWNFAYFLTRQSHAADDISQDVFLSAYDKLYSFRGECSVKSWLLTITRNKSLHYLKSAFIRKVTLRDTLTFRKDASPSAEQVVLDRLESNRLWSYVMELPRKYREAIILDYHYGLTMREIALLLDISEGTVKSRVFRAKQKISERLATAAEREEE
ncbi:RNA polymerase sigma factor [Paenibacillus sp. 32352]|uniref:RNA polymerase sigma factor n=1 Tax=Paenibacillus TaxID=44249 RepID=UPI0021186FD6|nr:sigma-70 family RNA polymerase sigma factor [Paenibacillus sp. 32352]